MSSFGDFGGSVDFLSYPWLGRRGGVRVDVKAAGEIEVVVGTLELTTEVSDSGALLPLLDFRRRLMDLEIDLIIDGLLLSICSKRSISALAVVPFVARLSSLTGIKMTTPLSGEIPISSWMFDWMRVVLRRLVSGPIRLERAVIFKRYAEPGVVPKLKSAFWSIVTRIDASGRWYNLARVWESSDSSLDVSSFAWSMGQQ